MVTDTMEHLGQYIAQFPQWQEVSHFYQRAQDGLEDGTYTLPSGISVLVKSYETKDLSRCRYESHRHTIDLMIGLTGEEYIHYVPAEMLTPEEDLAPKDAVKYSEKIARSRVLLSPGTFAAFFPGEAHAVAGVVGAPCILKKLVVKLSLEAKA